MKFVALGMFSLYNNQLLESEKVSLNPSERSFQYGDGFFETMMVQAGKIRFWEQHEKRIQEALGILGLGYDLSILKGRLEELVKQNKSNKARLRVTFWRAAGGLYTPDSDQTHVLATQYPVENVFTEKTISLLTANKAYKEYSPYSSIKSLNALPYVLAGIEARQRNTPDLLLYNGANKISETISSNIYFVKAGKIQTPSLRSGCVNGIVRRVLIQQLNIEETALSINDIHTFDSVFTTNVAGVQWISQINEKTFRIDTNLQEKIRSIYF